ncbi:hypothetical protein P7C70_g3343, partial [Phenoliferia sp. Uapishka_3]
MLFVTVHLRTETQSLAWLASPARTRFHLLHLIYTVPAPRYSVISVAVRKACSGVRALTIETDDWLADEFYEWFTSESVRDVCKLSLTFSEDGPDPDWPSTISRPIGTNLSQLRLQHLELNWNDDSQDLSALDEVAFDLIFGNSQQTLETLTLDNLPLSAVPGQLCNSFQPTPGIEARLLFPNLHTIRVGGTTASEAWREGLPMFPGMVGSEPCEVGDVDPRVHVFSGLILFVVAVRHFKALRKFVFPDTPESAFWERPGPDLVQMCDRKSISVLSKDGPVSWDMYEETEEAPEGSRMGAETTTETERDE